MDKREAMLLQISLMAAVLTLCMAQGDWDQRCGPLCKCKWVSGKKTAECLQQKITYVPTELSSEIQILDLTGNRIPYLPHNAFSTVNLVNLHKLVLRECEMESIDTYAFNGLKIVIEIDLAGNKITKIFPGTFVETQRLRILHLNGNSLEVLENGLFQDLIYLQKIVLSDNRLIRIGERTFHNLPSLQTLTLDGNNLTTVRLSTFESLSKLSSLELHNNPWNCDCHLKRFRDWVLSRRLYTKPTSCSQPENLAGNMWDEVSSDDFDCRPKVLIGPDITLGTGGGNVKVWCRTSGIPRPQLSWTHESETLSNSSRRRNGDGNYIVTEGNDWLNLTILDASRADKGDYICVAKSPGGSIDKTVRLMIAGDNASGAIGTMSFPLILGLGTTILILLLVILVGLIWYYRKRTARAQNKSADERSLEQHGLGEQEKSLIAPGTPAKQSVTSHGSYGAGLNGSLLESGSIFVAGPRVAVRTGDAEHPTLDLDQSTVTRGGSCRHFPPDLLAFPGGREASQTSQVSTVPDHSHPMIMQQAEGPQQSGAFGSSTGLYPAGFRTLPHNRSFGATSSHNNSGLSIMLRQGYVTIPRRPRPPSWGSSGAKSPTPGPVDEAEPIYDRLGVRTTADGSSVLSLNKSPEPGSKSTIRGRPLPRTPTANPHYNAMQRSTPNILTSSPLDRSAPEGAPGWPTKLPEEINKRIMHPQDCSTLGRKLPPRPPPKPENRLPAGPLFEDEDEDGTEV